jgi:hypothetical protein
MKRDLSKHLTEIIHIHFNYDFESPPIDISKTYGFEVTAFPPVKPKYESLKRRFNGNDLVFYEEDKPGVYHLESMSSPIEVKVIVSPNLWEEKTKKCEIKFSYIGLPYKYNSRKQIVDFAKDVSSRISWKQKIVWFTEDGEIIIWKNSSKEK